MAFAIPLLAMGGSMAAGVGTLGTIAGIASTGLSVFGALKSASAKSDSANYNARIAQNNAAIATQNASLTAQEGEINAQTAQMKSRAEVGGILASQGASGVDVNKGSSVDVRSSAASMGQLNAINIRANAARKAYGYQAESSNYMAQSELDKANAKNEKTAGYLKAATTFLGSVADNNWGGFMSGKGMDAPNFIGMNGSNNSGITWDS